MSIFNDWRKKREYQHDTHNVHAGKTAFIKNIRHRKSRRRNSKYLRDVVKGKVPREYL